MDRDELFTVDLVLLHPELGIVPALIMLGLAVLLGFYFWHCFFLENTVQSWYRIAEKLREKGVRRRRTRVVYDKMLASGGNRQNKFIENRQNWIIEKDQTTQFWLIS